MQEHDNAKENVIQPRYRSVGQFPRVLIFLLTFAN